MAQYLSMVPSQQMRLEQRLTPQLIQSMEILQLPLAALEARIRSEMESNPVLEESDAERPEEAAEVKEDPPQSEENASQAESFERLERLSRDLELDPGDLPFGRSGSSGAGTGERDSKMDAMANTASREEGLAEQLHRQWALLDDVDPAVRRAGEAIIDWMDEDGYLRTESDHHPRSVNGDTPEATPLILKRTPEETARLMEEIANSVNPPLSKEDLELALELVQTLEPPGVGARDLTECLLIQLEAKGPPDELQEALIRDHLIALAKNMLPAVAKKLNRPVEEIREAMLAIGKLNHHPGLLVQPVNVPRVSPDLIVDYTENGDGYTVRLARGGLSRLRISPQYRRMLQEKAGDKEALEFIRKRIEAAGTLIDAIQYRRERMLEIGRLIVDRQREFFDYGPHFLKVLRMRDVAEQFGCDPSTISRTVDEKYMQTPRGIFPLRMFFTGGTESAAGEAMSWDSVRAKVKQIIDEEDKASPLKDEEIVAKLAAQGVDISRRTVAKYRAQLAIPAAPQRKVF